MIALVQALGLAVPSEIPVVNFWPYIDTEGNDGDACKGVVYARVRPSPGGPPLNLFASHTQADTNVVEEHKTARSAQMAEIGAFVKACCGGWPLAEETFVCGDFNVFGEQTNEHVGIAEWASYFARPGHHLTDHLTDLWGCHQAPGEPGARDLGHRNGATCAGLVGDDERRTECLLKLDLQQPCHQVRGAARAEGHDHRDGLRREWLRESSRREKCRNQRE